MTCTLIAGYVFRRKRKDRWDLIRFTELRKGDLFKYATGKPFRRPSRNLLIAIEDAHDPDNGWEVAFDKYTNPLTSDIDDAKYLILLSADEEKLFRRLAQR